MFDLFAVAITLLLIFYVRSLALAGSQLVKPTGEEMRRDAGVYGHHLILLGVAASPGVARALAPESTGFFLVLIALNFGLGLLWYWAAGYVRNLLTQPLMETAGDVVVQARRGVNGLGLVVAGGFLLFQILSIT